MVLKHFKHNLWSVCLIQLIAVQEGFWFVWRSEVDQGFCVAWGRQPLGQVPNTILLKFPKTACITGFSGGRVYATITMCTNFISSFRFPFGVFTNSHTKLTILALMATLYYHNLHFPSLCATCDVSKCEITCRCQCLHEDCISRFLSFTGIVNFFMAQLKQGL